MKVVQINCSASGSTGNIAKAIHRQLREQGHESYIFYEVGNATEENMFRIGNCFSLHVHAVLSRSLGMQGYFSIFPTLRLIHKLKTIAPDIIHLHNLHGSYLHLPMLFGYLKKASCNVVITLHDCWLFTGKCPHFTVAGCERWKEQCGDCPQLSIYPGSKVDTTKRSLKDKKQWLSGFGERMRIVAVSNWLRDTAKQSFLGQYPIKTIYNGIDCDVFRPVDPAPAREKYGLENKFVILGVASVWDARKGLFSFVEMAKQLTDREMIVLVGLSEEQCKQMPANIVGIARTESQQELVQIYSAADVFVSVSKEETFGLVTAEAMACGTPVVVYDSTACAEVVCGGGAVLSPTSGTGELLNAARRVGMAKNDLSCRQTVQERFEKKTMVQGYMGAYENEF